MSRSRNAVNSIPPSIGNAGVDQVVVVTLFQYAVAALQAGRLSEAEERFRQVLSVNSQHADSLHLLAGILQQKGNLRDAEILTRQALAIREDASFFYSLGNQLVHTNRLVEAEVAYSRALELSPDFVDAHYMLAIALMHLNRLAEAEVSFRRVIELRPDSAMAYNNLGILLVESGRTDSAEDAYRFAIKLSPELLVAYTNLGNLLVQSGRLAEAEGAYRRALELRPDLPEVHNSLARLFVEAGRFQEAEAAFRRLLDLRPDVADAHNNLGLLFEKAGRVCEAEASYRRALELRSDYAQAYSNLGNLLMSVKRFSEAETAYSRLLELDPNFAEAHNNVGMICQEVRRLSDAEQAYRRALELKPDYADAHNNLGSLLYETNRLPEAEALLRRALKLRSDYAEAKNNLGHLLLTLGRYDEAWPAYEARYDHHRLEPAATIPDLPYPQWRGESLAGKSLVVWPEQGFGDYIQFARYGRLLKDRNVSRLTLVCAPALKDLFESIEDVDSVIADGEPVPQHDYWSFPLSLPLLFGTEVGTIPGDLPYLKPAPARVAHWRNRLPNNKGKTVGLVWKGQPKHRNDHNRSLPGIVALAPLWSVPGVTFVSLQKGPGEEDALNFKSDLPILAIGSEMNDFADTAAIVSQLDLVICVDTSVAHLAGSLAKPCWVLLPVIGTDWRWLLRRSDSPWYPGVMRLFRQSSAGDWTDTIMDVTDALRTWVEVAQ